MTKKTQQTTLDEHREIAEAPQNELWNQLGNAVTMAAKQDQIVWTIFGVFWAANAVLLVALFTTGELPNVLIGIVVSIIGTILSGVWFFIQRRSVRWLKYYERIVLQLEEKYLKIPSDVALSADINRTAFMEIVGLGPRVRSIMVWSGVVTALGWIIVFVIIACK